MAIFRGTGGTGDSTTDTTVNTVTQKAAEAAASATAAASSATQAANSAASINANIVNDTTPQLGGELDGQTNKITNIGDPTSAQDAATKTYVDSQVQSKDALSELSGDSDDITEGSTNLFLTTTERTKLSGIEASATADQTAAEIRTLVESASDSNVFTDADHSKLDGIEASATADQTDAEIKTAYENNSDTNAFTDAEKTKLSGIETGATADQTASEILTAIKTVDGSGSGLDADLLDGNEASAFATSAQGSTADSALQNVSEDTTPQLGGDLDLNSNDITGTGNINITGTLQTSSNAIIGGDLTVSGTTTTVNTETINLADNNIVLNSNHTGTPTQNAGITIERGTSTDKVFQWNESSDYWETDDNFNVTGNITVSGTVDGRDVAADGTTLDAVASTYVNVSGDTLTGDLAFGDNVKAKFGASDDLQIYHDGSNSYITDPNGFGNLILRGSANVQIEGANGENCAIFNENSSVRLFYDNVEKFATTSSGVDITGVLTTDGITTSADVSFGDNVKAKFGVGNDLQIYHDGTKSYISDQGTGNLKIIADNLVLTNAAETNTYFVGDGSTGGVNLKYGNATKFDTTSSGVNVTGTVTADGATIDGTLNVTSNALNLNASSPAFTITDSDTSAYHVLSGASGYGSLFLTVDAGSSGAGGGFFIQRNANTPSLSISNSTGDISFYEDTGTTAKLIWDASAEELQFKDNVKAEFGDGGDLKIYHSGSASYITEVGTGSLVIGGDVVALKYEDANESYLRCYANDRVDIYYDNAIKLTTTSTGIDVTGTVTADGLTVEGAVTQKVSGNATLKVHADTDTSPVASLELQRGANDTWGADVYTDYRFRDEVGDLFIEQGSSGNTVALMKLGDNSDISFYDDAGTSQDLYWDASTSRLGLGTTSPAQRLHLDYGSNILTGSGEVAMKMTVLSSLVSAQNEIRSGVTSGTNPYMSFAVREATSPYATVERMRIDSGGSVGIGTTSPQTVQEQFGGASKGLTIEHGIATLALVDADSSNAQVTWLSQVSGNTYLYNKSSGNLIFGNNTAEIARFDSSGNLLVGHTSVLNPVQNGGAGISLRPGGNIYAGSTAASLFLNRENSNGEIAQFRKDGTAIGSLGVANNDNLFISGDAGHSGLSVGSEGVLAYANGDYRDGTEDLGQSSVRWRNLYLSNGVHADTLKFSSLSGTEYGRFDSSGNLLVGTTDTTVGSSSTLDGIALLIDGSGGGVITAARSGGAVARLNRQSTDGEIINLRKNGTTIGSIGVLAGHLGIAEGGCGLRFENDTQRILPANSTYGTNDASIDLGRTDGRFKDLYLSGGVYLGGTGSANLLDDYEEGTWTPVLVGSTSGSISSFNTQQASYVKVGDLVQISLYLNSVNVSTSTISGNILIGGLPFSGDSFSGVANITYCNLFNFVESDVSITGYFNGTSIHLIKGSSTTSITDSDESSGVTGGALMMTLVYQI